MSAASGPLPARVAYRLWAPTYEHENVMTALDELAVSILDPVPPREERLLDAGCGTGRRLPEKNAVGVDLVVDMIAAGDGSGRMACGDIGSLPLSESSFDVIWCRLAVGHLERLDPFYREACRVLRRGGRLLVTDFHPEAARRGLRRTFKDAEGASRSVLHVVHEPRAHEEAADAHGLAFVARLELAVGPDVKRLFTAAGEERAYEEKRGLPILLGFRFAKA